MSVASQTAVDGSTTFYARYTDTRGHRAIVAPTGGVKSLTDWDEAFTAACDT